MYEKENTNMMKLLPILKKNLIQIWCQIEMDVIVKQGKLKDGEA